MSSELREPMNHMSSEAREPRIDAGQLFSIGAFQIRAGAAEIRLHIQNHAWGTKALGFSGGVALATLALLGMLNVSGIVSDIIHYVMYIYLFMIGAMVAIVEGKWFNDFQRTILTYFYFYDPLPGKCAFYVFIGILLCSTKSAVFTAVGVYFLLIAAFLSFMLYRQSAPPDTAALVGDQV